ncbi:MAG: hypothetical protein ABIL58_18285 [Pseudomonadota bacterium]
MKQDNRLATLILIVIFGAMVQVVLAAGDGKDAPYKAATEFTQKYFYLDPSMADQMCNAGVTEDDVDMVDNYLYAKQMEASARGYDVTRLRKSFSHIKTQTVDMTNESATVHISGTARTIINPVFGWFGKMFFITTPEHLEATLDLVKEDGKWKVCGEPLTLSAVVAE